MTSTKPISPFKEIVAYESLWQGQKVTFKYLSQLFASRPGARPSDLVAPEVIAAVTPKIKEIFLSQGSYRTNTIINGAFDYPERLREAKHPVELLYYAGNLDLLDTRCISVVGSRNPSPAGIQRTVRLVKNLVKDGFTIISGLAAGIDRAAHTTAIEAGGKTIAVIGTPLNQFYPKDNSELQKQIAADHLLMTQVPFIQYSKQSIWDKKLFFPERNITMSALSEATVIIEAGQTSGTLTQARAALYQKRKLFILDSCFQNKEITWPAYYEARGAIRVRDFSDILSNLLSGNQSE